MHTGTQGLRSLAMTGLAPLAPPDCTRAGHTNARAGARARVFLQGGGAMGGFGVDAMRLGVRIFVSNVRGDPQQPQEGPSKELQVQGHLEGVGGVL